MNAQPSPQPNSYSFTEPTPWRKSMGHALLGMALCALTLRFLWLDYLLMNAQPSPQPNSYSFTEPTPWRKSMGHALLGMALCALTLRFLWLDYLLPAIGMVLSLWGFRALRQENKWFQRCFVLAVLKISVTVPILILNTTVLPEMLRDTPILFALTVLGTLLPLAEAFCLWRALCAAQCAVNRPPHARAAALLTLWYAFLIILALMQASGLLLVGGFFVIYFVLLHRVKRLVTELETAGYAVYPAPVRVSDGQVALALSAVLILGGGLGYLFGGSVPMDWHAMETSDEHAEIRAHLLELGFPEAVLNDLTPEDLAACDGALRVAVHTDEYPARLNQSPYMDSHLRSAPSSSSAAGLAICSAAAFRWTGTRWKPRTNMRKSAPICWSLISRKRC